MASNSLVLPLAVSKAPFVVSSPHKEPATFSNSHEHLMQFLRRRHSKYLAKMKNEKRQGRSRGSCSNCALDANGSSNDRTVQVEAKRAGKDSKSDSPTATSTTDEIDGDIDRKSEYVMAKAKHHVIRKSKHKTRHSPCPHQRHTGKISSHPRIGAISAGNSPQKQTHGHLPLLHSSQSIVSTPTKQSTPIKSRSPGKPVISPLVKAANAKQERVTGAPCFSARRVEVNVSSRRLSMLSLCPDDDPRNSNIKCRRRLMFPAEACNVKILQMEKGREGLDQGKAKRKQAEKPVENAQKKSIVDFETEQPNQDDTKCKQADSLSQKTQRKEVEVREAKQLNQERCMRQQAAQKEATERRTEKMNQEQVKRKQTDLLTRNSRRKGTAEREAERLNQDHAKRKKTELLVRKAQQKEAEEREAERLNHEHAKRKQAELLARKAQQRAEIYALNKEMTLLEEMNFQEYICSKV